MQQVGHKARLETAVECTQWELVGKLPACSTAHADYLRHCIHVCSGFDSQYKRLGYSSRNGATQDVIDDLNNLTCAGRPNVENVLLLAHCLQYWTGLLKYLAFASHHDREGAVNCALGTAT